MTMNIGFRLLIAASLLHIPACKKMQNSDSDLETLDNFASGDSKGYATNRCEGPNLGASFKLTKAADYAQLSSQDHANNVVVLQHGDAGDVSEATMTALKKAYGALPVATQSLLRAFRLKVRLAKDVGSLCGAAFTSDTKADLYMSERDKAKIDACWRFLTVTGDNHRSLEIVIKNNPTDVAHYLVRQVGYLYSQYFMYLEGQEAVVRAARGQISSEELNQIKGLYHGVKSDQEFVDMKRKLTVSFLDDMVEPKDKAFAIENLNYLLGNGIETKQAIIQARNAGQKDLAAYFAATTFNIPGGPSERQKSAYATGFTDYVLAESFDSAVCNVAGTGKTVEGRSVNTAARFKELFPQTHAVWTNLRSQRKYQGTVGYLNILQMHSRHLADVVNTYERGQAGLRLTTYAVQNNYQPATIDVLGKATGSDAASTTFNNGNLQPQSNARSAAAYNQYMAQMAAINAQTNQALQSAISRIAAGLGSLGSAAVPAASREANAELADDSGCPGCGCSGPGCSCKNCQNGSLASGAAAAQVGCSCGGSCGKGGCSNCSCATCAMS